MTGRATIFVVDDDTSVRTGLARLLRASGFQVETFESGEALMARAPYEGSGCVILDVRMPGTSGIDLQQQLSGGPGELPVIFLSGHGDVPDTVRAMKQGAVDFLTKPVDAEVLLAAIATALERHATQRATRAERHAVLARLAALTPREHDVLSHVVTGALNKQIAADLGITEGTVKVHRGRVMEKLGAQSVADLVRLWDLAGRPASGASRNPHP